VRGVRRSILRYDEAVGAARFAVTDRPGGVSEPPFDELNLGGHVGDDPARVRENRRRLAAALGQPVDRMVFMNQAHGADVAVVDRPWPADPPEVDAVVTRATDLVLAVLVADCVPVLLADPGAGVVAVAHAGRRGLVAGVVSATVSAMRDLGADEIRARIGPSVCGGCYEVPAQLRDEVTAVIPEAGATTYRGTPAVDVAAGVEAQLGAAGVTTTRVPGCTVEDPTLYSYRRDRTTGRFAGLAWLAAG
jgi:polyphenol oxidase